VLDAARHGNITAVVLAPASRAGYPLLPARHGMPVAGFKNCVPPSTTPCRCFLVRRLTSCVRWRLRRCGGYTSAPPSLATRTAHHSNHILPFSRFRAPAFGTHLLLLPAFTRLLASQLRLFLFSTARADSAPLRALLYQRALWRAGFLGHALKERHTLPARSALHDYFGRTLLALLRAAQRRRFAARTVRAKTGVWAARASLAQRLSLA